MQKWNDLFDTLDHALYYALQPFVLFSVFLGMWMQGHEMALTFFFAAGASALSICAFPRIKNSGKTSLRYGFAAAILLGSLAFGFYMGESLFWKVVLGLYIASAVMRALSALREEKSLGREFGEAAGTLAAGLVLLLCVRVFSTGESRGFEDMLVAFMLFAPVHLIRANLREAYGQGGETVGREKNLLLLNLMSLGLMALVTLLQAAIRYGWAAVKGGFGGFFALLKQGMEWIVMAVGYGAQWLYYWLQGFFTDKESPFQKNEGGGGGFTFQEYEDMVYESHVVADIIEVISLVLLAALVGLILLCIGRRLLRFFLDDAQKNTRESEERQFIYREREKTGLMKKVQAWLSREELSPTRKAYKREVEVLQKQGIAFKTADTPGTYLKKTADSGSFKDLTAAYEQERYGRTGS